MIRTMASAVNTMNQLQQQLDIIGNNLSHTDTTGYKSSTANFHELLYQQFNNDKMDTAPRASAEGIRYGVGAVLGPAQLNWKVGSMQGTGRELDFALTEPRQYFNLLMPGEGGEQVAYTRQGNFYVSPVEGGQLMLVNGDGYPVADSAGNPIAFRDDVKNYSLRPNGILEVVHHDGTTDRIEMAVTTVERPNLMARLSATAFAFPDNAQDLGVTRADVLTEMTGQLRGGIGMQNQFLESSNVNYEKEMTDLINVQRAYQFNARSVSLSDQMLGLINSIR